MEEKDVYEQLKADLKKITQLGEEKGISRGVIKGIETVGERLIEIGSLLKTESDYKRLRLDTGELVNKLLKSCDEGDDPQALGIMRQLRDKLSVFHTLLAKKEGATVSEIWVK